MRIVFEVFRMVQKQPFAMIIKEGDIVGFCYVSQYIVYSAVGCAECRRYCHYKFNVSFLTYIYEFMKVFYLKAVYISAWSSGYKLRI